MRTLRLLRIFLTSALALCAQNTAKFPGAVPTTAQMGVASNRAETTLTTGVNASVTSLPVSSSSGFKAGTFVTVDSEIIAICAVPDGTHLTVGVSACPNVDGRGIDTANGGGAAASHLSAAKVQGRIVAWHQNQAAAEVIAIANKLHTELVSVKDFGAKGDGSTDDSTAIQAAVTAVCAQGTSVGQRALYFPTTSAYYNLGTTAISIGCGGIKLTGAKYVEIRKTGSGNFFTIPVPGTTGYSIEIENLHLKGDNTSGQIGIDVSGSGGTGPSVIRIHDCFFDSLGANQSDPTGGGNILIAATSLMTTITNNLFTSGGYGVRVTAASDGLLVRDNITNISKGFFVELINTVGAGSQEVSHNDIANVGGAVFTNNSGGLLVVGNEYVPGEAGSLGPMVKYNDTGSLVADGAGTSSAYRFLSSFVLTVRSNFCSIGIVATGDTCIYLGDGQGQATVEDNVTGGAALYGIRVGAQNQTYINNRSFSGTLYNSTNHPGILHFGWDGLGNNYWSFGTSNTSAPFQLNLPDLTPTLGVGQFAISQKANPNKRLLMGWSDTVGGAYLYAYTLGTGVQQVTHKSPTVYLGFTDSSVLIVKGSAQGSRPWRYTATDQTTNLASLNATGSIFALENTTNPQFTATDATGVSAILQGSSGAGGAYIGTASNHPAYFVVNNIPRISATTTSNQLAGTAFASLGTPSNGSFVWCSDCTIGATKDTACVGAGGGSWAFRSAGIWKCPF